MKGGEDRDGERERERERALRAGRESRQGARRRRMKESMTDDERTVCEVPARGKGSRGGRVRSGEPRVLRFSIAVRRSSYDGLCCERCRSVVGPGASE